jgi:hypothetical protein
LMSIVKTQESRDMTSTKFKLAKRHQTFPRSPCLKNSPLKKNKEKKKSSFF